MSDVVKEYLTRFENVKPTINLSNDEWIENKYMGRDYYKRLCEIRIYWNIEKTSLGYRCKLLRIETTIYIADNVTEINYHNFTLKNVTWE